MECRNCFKDFDQSDTAEELSGLIGGWESSFPWGLDMCLDCALDEMNFDTEEFACNACGNPNYPACKDSCKLYDD